MKISELTKVLGKYKKDYGDIEVVFDETSVNEQADNDYSQHDVRVKGAYSIYDSDGGPNTKCLVLEGPYDQKPYGNTPLRKLKGKK